MKHPNKSLIHDISYHTETRMELLLSLPQEQQARIFVRLSKHVQKQLLSELEQSDIVRLLESLDPDEGTDVVQLLPKKKQKKLLSLLNEKLQKQINSLLNFDTETAAGLMSLDYVQVDDHESISEIVEQIKKHENKTGRLPTVLVLEQGKLVGFLPGHKLIFSKKTDTAKQFVKKIPTINYTADFDAVLQIFKNNPHQKVVVIGEHAAVLGVIYSDDVLQLIQEQPGKSLTTFAGVQNEESVFDSARKKVQSRSRWLIINLFTTLLAAFTVQFFEATIAKNVLLAVYMPIVAGMGGNAGTQTLAVMVRSLSNSELSNGMIRSALKNEIIAGFANGAITGLIIFVIVSLLNQDAVVALTLGFAMIVNLTVAATFGTLMPIVMKKLGKDPAASATIFITTATDIFGFFAFLGLATLLLF